MPFSIKCQVCDFGFKVGDEFAGRRGKCPKCGEGFQVPVQAPPMQGTPSLDASASQILRKAKLLGDAASEQPEVSDSVMLRRAKLLDDMPTIHASDSSTSKRAHLPPPPDQPFPGFHIDTTASAGEKSALHKTGKPVPKSSPSKSPLNDAPLINFGDPSVDRRATSPPPPPTDGPFLGFHIDTSASAGEKSTAGRSTSKSSLALSAGPPSAGGSQAQTGEPPVLRRRRKGPAVPIWVWIAACSIGTFSVFCVVAYNAFSGFSAAPVAKAAPPPKKQVEKPRFDLPPIAPIAPANEIVTYTVRKPPVDAPLEDVVEYVEHGIVKIDTFDNWDRNGLGSGFVIDKSGLVATNYHVVADCVKADVLFNNGVRFSVEGYMALRPECDLAILKLSGVPENVHVLDLNIKLPRSASLVYAIGHPHDYKFSVTNGIVSALPLTSELPAGSQGFLKEFMTDKVNSNWIQHNAQIAPGNSGGPLINARGEVIGINTWVDQNINAGFAIHAKHLHDLWNNPLSSVAPLAQFRRPPERVVRQQAPGITLSVEQIKQLFAANAAKDWQPKAKADYELLGQLAFLVTYINNVRQQMKARPADVTQEFEAIARQADDASQELQDFAWKTDPHVTAVNTYAATSVFHRGEGVFLFGNLKKTFADKEGRKGMVLSLTGTKVEVFVPLLDGTDEPPVDTPLLVLGVSRGSMFMGENPLDQKQVPLVLSYTVLKVAP